MSAVTSPYSRPDSATWSELCSDGLHNFYANYYTDFDDDELIVVKNVIILLEPTTTNAATLELVKKNLEVLKNSINYLSQTQNLKAKLKK